MKKIIVAVVCHQGLGSSLWLKVQVEKILKKYCVPAQVLQMDIAGIGGMDPEIAIGVSYLKEQLHEHAKTTILVDNILQNKEIEKQLTENEYIKPYLE